MNSEKKSQMGDFSKTNHQSKREKKKKKNSASKGLLYSSNKKMMVQLKMKIKPKKTKK